MAEPATDAGRQQHLGTGSFDPWSRSLNRSNIWQIYHAMRQEAAAVRSGAYGGYWLLPRYSDVKNAALNHKVFSSRFGTRIGIQGTVDPRAAAIEYDPPEHRKFRSAMIAPFTAKRIGEFSGLVERYASAIVANVLSAGSFDIVHDIAGPMSVGVISEIIGFDGGAKDRNRELALALIGAGYETVSTAGDEYNRFLEQEVQKRINAPTAGFLGELVSHATQDAEFDVRELVAIARALALAGHHTTINGISSMLLRVADEELRNHWLSDPESDLAISGFVEETLRIDPPIHLEGRRTTEPVKVGDVCIPAGSQVALLFGSANHDDEMFPEPEEFNPLRPVGHLSFGHGIHTCLGMGLARLEMASVLKEVHKHIPRVRLSGTPVDSGMIFGHHMGWEAMPAVIE